MCLCSKVIIGYKSYNVPQGGFKRYQSSGHLGTFVSGGGGDATDVRGDGGAKRLGASGL
jgi:hypothetical protein